MSAVAGMVDLSGAALPSGALEPMRRLLAHRNVAGITRWQQGACALLHAASDAGETATRLSVADDVVAVWAGRLDQPASPVAQRGDDHVWPSTAEQITDLYRRWRAETPSRLLGDFVLALWDRRIGRLYLAGDPIGVKPLYYARRGDLLIFASEAKAVAAGASLPYSADHVSLSDFERQRFRSIDRTFFEGIRRLPSGSCLRADADGIELIPSWRLDPLSRIESADRSALVADFRRLFLDAVRVRLPRSGRVVVALSGGVDSSSVLAAAVNIQRSERPHLSIEAISLLSRELPDEGSFARQVCDHLGVACTPLYVEDVDPLEGLERMLWCEESPLYDVVDAFYQALYRQARAMGARVVLSGGWGDQVLTGQAYPVDLFRQGLWRQSLRELRLLPKNDGGRLPDILRVCLRYLLLPQGIPDKYEGLRHLVRRARQVCSGGRTPDAAFPMASQRELYDGIFSPHKQRLLECLERGAACNGVEVRLPFLDRRLVECLMALPVQERIRDGLGKQLLRGAVADLLPASIIRRTTKGDFTHIILARLGAVGFSAPTLGEVNRLWNAHVLKVWKEVWNAHGTRAQGREQKETLSTAEADGVW